MKSANGKNRGARLVLILLAALLAEAALFGVLSEARIDESVLRILALKEGQGLLP